MRTEIRLDELLVRQVEALIETVARNTSGDDLDRFRNRAHLYRFIAAECTAMAKVSSAYVAMAEAKQAAAEDAA
jgi:hypothetical protein